MVCLKRWAFFWPDDWLSMFAVVKETVHEAGQVKVAGQIGISERTLRNLLGGGSPSAGTRRRVRAWLRRPRADLELR